MVKKIKFTAKYSILISLMVSGYVIEVTYTEYIHIFFMLRHF